MSFFESYIWTSYENAREMREADLPKHTPALMRQNSDDARVDSGDRVLLPPSALEKLMSQFSDELPSPLTFELRANRSVCYVGVQEFTSLDDVITLPKAVIDALGLTSAADAAASPKISVRYIRLPKAKKMIIQPLTADFLDIPNHKSFLENGLRDHFTALFQNQMVTLRHAGLNYSFLVKELQPTAPACVIINTDCELHIEEPMNLHSTSGPRRATQYLKPGEPVEGSVDADQYLYYCCGYTFGMAPETSDIKVTLKCTSGDADAYISPHPLTKPTLLNHTWAINGVGGGVTLLQPGKAISSESAEDVSMTIAAAFERKSTLPKSFYIGVTGYKGPAAFTLTYEIVPRGAGAGADEDVGLPIPSDEPEHSTASTGTTHMSEPVSTEGRKQCPHCGTWVLEANYVLHAASCARNNVKCPYPGCGAILRKAPDVFDKHWHCPTCHKVMPKAVGDKHHTLFHEAHKCSCGVILTLTAMRKHVQEDCPNRLVVCRFCGDTVKAGLPPTDYVDRDMKLTEHEAYCGSRQAPCTICNSRVMLKQIAAHFALLHPGMEVQLPDPEQLQASSTSSRGSQGLPDSSPGMVWSCAGCTLENGSQHQACTACGTARPADAVLKHPSSEASTDSLVEETGPWDCPGCTFHNTFGQTCDVCNGRRPPPAAKPAVPGATVGARGPACRNMTCANTVARSGEAKSAGLCDRCYDLFAADYGNAEDMQSALLNRYNSQMSMGCGNGSCNNQYCRDGWRHTNKAPSTLLGAPRAAPLARQASADDFSRLLNMLYADPPSYYVCVSTQQRVLPVLGRGPSSDIIGTAPADASTRGRSASSGPTDVDGSMRRGSSGSASGPAGEGVTKGGERGAIAAAARARLQKPGDRVASAFFK